MDVQDQAIDGLGILQAEELLGRAERFHREAGTFEEAPQGPKDENVVVDDTNDSTHPIPLSRSSSRMREERRAGFHWRVA
jgi:carboxypeptidase C (cathepsin A)